MNLVRNTTRDGSCKYSLVEHQKDDHIEQGLPFTENEFFVIKLKDRHAKAALEAYAKSIESTDEMFAGQVYELAERAGPDSPWCKDPD